MSMFYLLLDWETKTKRSSANCEIIMRFYPLSLKFSAVMYTIY